MPRGPVVHVEVDDEHLPPNLGQRACNVNCVRRLPYASLLVADGDDACPSLPFHPCPLLQRNRSHLSVIALSRYRQDTICAFSRHRENVRTREITLYRLLILRCPEFPFLLTGAKKSYSRDNALTPHRHLARTRHRDNATSRHRENRPTLLLTT